MEIWGQNVGDLEAILAWWIFWVTMAATGENVDFCKEKGAVTSSWERLFFLT